MRHKGKWGVGLKLIENGVVSTVAGTIALLMVVCLQVSPALATDGSCPNEARRVEQSSTYMSNCRAYEQVSPVDKDSGEPEAVEGALRERNIFAPARGGHAAVNGKRVAWVSEYFLPGLAGPSSPGLDYLSTRTETNGWTSEAAVPPQSPENGLVCFYFPGIVGWSRNLTQGILAIGAAQEFGSSGGAKPETFGNDSYGCGHAEPGLREADGAEIKEPGGFQNLFRRDNDTRFYQLVNVTPGGEPTPTPSQEYQTYFASNFLAGDSELEHVAFEDELPLTEEAEKLTPAVEVACKEEPKGRACWEGHDDVYVWSQGEQPAVRMVTVLPNGKAAEGRLAGATRNDAREPLSVADYRHVISEDGSRIFFEAEGKLYVRENGGQPPINECTSSTAACTIQLDAKQGGSGEGGGKWLGASADGSRVFFIDEKELTSTSTAELGKPDLYEYAFEAKEGERLKDLTKGTTEPADVLGVSGISENGAYLYFVAQGQLVADEGISGQPNLYVIHGGETKFIATLNSTTDNCVWTLDAECETNGSGGARSGLTARISANGLYLAFNSTNALTGYDNTDSMTGTPDEEIFLYEVEGSRIVCVSCNPNSNIAPSAGGAAIDWPAVQDTNSEVTVGYPQRNVSEAGQVFFETSEALLPNEDTNGLRDVYEYERPALHLISSGISAAPSYFMDATPSGSDVFFATAQKLLPGDTDSVYDIYDARIGGGFAKLSLPPTPCESETCKSAASATSVFSVPSSAMFAGPGDIVQPKSPSQSKAKETATHKYKAMLIRELRACQQRYRHDKQKRAQCEQRMHKSLAQKKVKASRRARRDGGR